MRQLIITMDITLLLNSTVIFSTFATTYSSDELKH